MSSIEPPRLREIGLWLQERIQSLARYWIVPAALLIGIVLGRIFGQLQAPLAAYAAVTLIGAMVGVTELVGRYRDRPTAPLETWPGVVYILVNAMAAFIVFWLLRTNQLGMSSIGGLGGTLNQVLLAGFGSMALFRTSIFSLRVKETDIAIGPAAALQVILKAADRACDRQRAGPRARRVKTIMHGVSFTEARTALPLHCVALMQNVLADEQSQLEQAIASLEKARMSDEAKAYNLGLLLMNLVGEDVLAEAVAALGNSIKGPPTDDPPIFAEARLLLSAADLAVLALLCLELTADAGPAEPEKRQGWVRDFLTFPDAFREDSDRNQAALARLRHRFGPNTVALALARMDRKRLQPVTTPLTTMDLGGRVPASPSPPPSPAPAP
ncbi:hypothetical protein [Roseomonas sp. 18066]|uniref:hypothetical protein n=1 Tax=Roseomonas sp. 18066 TaxID=2681412 RepID=UPI0013597E7F|nr:hypothetical protein [Roseomonas sp. 18066]